MVSSIKMAPELSLFFVLLILFIPSCQSLLHEQAYQIPDHAMQSLISQACTGIEDQISCQSSIRSRLQDNPSKGHRRASSVLAAAIETSMNNARLAGEMLSRFTSLSSSTSREQFAVEDCKELLDYTVTELAWSLDEMREIRAKSSSSTDESGHRQGSHEGNLRAWLSAALSNQDTCIEGFEGTNRQVANSIKGSLMQVTQLVENVLTMYTRLHALPFKPPRNSNNRGGSNRNSGGMGDAGKNKHSSKGSPDDFPKWMTEGDKGLLVADSRGGMHADAVVALDGRGHYRSIGEAIDRAPDHSNRRYVIHVMKGVYNENIDMKKKKTNIMLVGEGIGVTVVSNNRNFMQGWTTFRTATVAVSGKGFIARDITFRNTAGPNNHQAVALRVDSDQSAFYRCSIEGYQDTLYAHSLRQFYRECNIYGTIDFIFGNGAAVLQNCKIYTRMPLALQKVTIVAQGRKSPNQNTGFSIQDSFVFATQPSYLGRPWKQFSRVVYMNTFMSNMVQPRGWLEWYGNFALNTLYFGEYRNYGPGANLSGRVNWPGYHIIRDASEATLFTVGRFIDGISWLPSTGVRFTSGLKN